jgi:hypothetical protein
MDDWLTHVKPLPIDELKPLCADGLKPLVPEHAAAEKAMDAMAALAADEKLIRRRQRRSFRDLRRAEAAAELLERLPRPDEAFHCIVRGTFALFDLVPAVLAIAAPAKIAALHIATLGFSRDNTENLCRLLDERKIGRARLLCSHYFSATSRELYQGMRDALQQRGQTFASRRTHAKVLAMKLTNRRTVLVESSANLRSCFNIEQLTVFGDPQLYKFHIHWIERLCDERKKTGSN